MRYVVTLGEETLELDLEVTADGGYRVRGAGGPDLSVRVLAGDSGLFSLLVDGETVRVQPTAAEVCHHQERYTVSTLSLLERAQNQMAPAVGAQSQKLLASMPGRIVRVLCEVGSAVRAGTPLVVMEAMKMQNELCAKAEAVVRALHVEVGQNVERGALLVEFE